MYNINDYLNLLGESELHGSGSGLFQNVKPTNLADETSLVWINPTRADKNELFESTLSRLIICAIDENFSPKKDQLLLKVKNPKLSFVRIAEKLFGNVKKFGIHPSSIIHPEAKIHSSASIGAFCNIGRCSIGAQTVVGDHCRILDNSDIGDHVIIQSGTVIGEDGFGYVKNDEGTWQRFPHIGGVTIGNHVEIGANTCIDRGALGNTVIGAGTKIDNLVHVAHNVEVGENTCIVALAMIGGSVRIGTNVWIGPSAVVRDTIAIGDNAVVGMGAVVTRSVPANETWTGSPAKELAEFKTLQSGLRRLTSQTD